MLYLLQIIGIGLVLLSAFVLMGRVVGRRDLGGARAGVRRLMLVYLPVWLIAVFAPLIHDIIKARTSLTEDGSFFLIAYVVPAAVALSIVWMLRLRPGMHAAR